MEAITGVPVTEAQIQEWADDLGSA